jgi:hypothetical protein
MADRYDKNIPTVNAIYDPVISLNYFPINLFTVFRDETAEKRVLREFFNTLDNSPTKSLCRDV